TLIDGSAKYSRGFRSDDEFYEKFVKPTYPVKDEWDSWTNGHWKSYWLAFWTVVRDFYNDQATRTGHPRLWVSDQQTNLTKAVTLRELQTLFIAKCIDHMQEIDATADILRNVLGDEEATQKIAQL